MKFQDIPRTFSRTVFDCRCLWHANAVRAWHYIVKKWVSEYDMVLKMKWYKYNKWHCKLPCFHTSGVNLVWNLGVVDLSQKNFDFPRQIFEKFWFIQAISQKISFFPGKLLKNLDFFRQFFLNFNFPGKNSSFTATSGKIILFLFKSHHFRTLHLSSSFDTNNVIYLKNGCNAYDFIDTLTQR